MTVIEKAYAKVNLFLDVLSRREDGFHNIKTVMHSVSICDEVELSCIEADCTNIRLTVEGNAEVPLDANNLAYRAAKKYLEHTGASCSVDLRLKKRIPMAAGLAGGSSDAAAVLRAMNRVFSFALSEEEMIDLAAELGSDVPYCLVGGTALCEGRGEIMTKIPSPAKMYFVIAISDEKVSTPLAYRELDKIYDNFSDRISADGEALLMELTEYLSGAVKSPPRLYNIFEEAILPVCPKAAKLRRDMLDAGAAVSVMSGSGPSVFGIFDSSPSAKAALKKLEHEGVRAFVAESV